MMASHASAAWLRQVRSAVLVSALTVSASACSFVEGLFGKGADESAPDLQNPYRETGVPVRALCGADEVDEQCRPKTRKTWKAASAVGYQPLQLQPAALDPNAKAVTFWTGLTTLGAAGSKGTATAATYDALIDAFLFRAVDGSAVPRPCATGVLSKSVRAEFDVFSPEQAKVNRLLAEDLARKTVLDAKVGLAPPELAAFIDIEAQLSSTIEEAVQHRLTESAVIRYVRVSSNRDAADLAGVKGLDRCLGRPLVMEVTGILVTNKSSHREVLMGTDVKQAIGAALAPVRGTPELAVKLEAAIGRAFDKAVREQVNLVISESEPVFYPYYVRVDAAPAPALQAAPKVARCVAGTVHFAGGAVPEGEGETMCATSIDDDGRPTRETAGIAVKVEGDGKRSDGKVFWQLEPRANASHWIGCECRAE